jgi:hypothetical protein
MSILFFILFSLPSVERTENQTEPTNNVGRQQFNLGVGSRPSFSRFVGSVSGGNLNTVAHVPGADNERIVGVVAMETVSAGDLVQVHF